MKLLEYLASEPAQKLYAEANFEFPVNAKAEVHPIIATMGTVTPDSMALSDVLPFRKRTSELVDEISFDTFSN